MNTEQDNSNFIHPLAAVQDGATIGARTRIWQFCTIVRGSVIGDDCNICSHCFIEGGVTVGSRVTIKSGVQLWTGVTVEDDVFVGPNATFTNDLFPRSGNRSFRLQKTLLKQGCSIGANSTILPITIGRWSMIAAGSVVTKDVPDFALVKGNPARFSGWICRCAENLFFQEAIAKCKCGRSFKRLNDSCVEELI